MFKWLWLVGCVTCYVVSPPHARTTHRSAYTSRDGTRRLSASVRRIREAVDYAREQRQEHEKRGQELARAARLTDVELRAILVGRGVHEARDEAVTRVLLVEMLAELRLAEEPRPPPKAPACEGLPVAVPSERLLASETIVTPTTPAFDRLTAHTRAVFGTLADKYGADVNRIRRAAAAKYGGDVKRIRRAVFARVRRRPKVVVPFVLNRLRGTLIDLCSWATNNRLSPKLVALLVLAAAFSDYGLRASIGLLLGLRLVTELIDTQQNDAATA